MLTEGMSACIKRVGGGPERAIGSETTLNASEELIVARRSFRVLYEVCALRKDEFTLKHGKPRRSQGGSSLTGTSLNL